jgi:soluble lytic murein transglycosylase-like protein
MTKKWGGVKKSLGFVVCAILLSASHVGAEQNSTVLANGPEEQKTKPGQPSNKYFMYTNKSGVRSYSDRPPSTGTKYVVREFFSCFACDPRSKVDWNNIPLHLEAFDLAINAAARKYQVDPALVRAVIHAESAFRPGARSKKGALGLMQLMPETAKDMGVVNVMVPEENIQGGVRYLAWLLGENRGNTMLATAAYNAGPGAVKRYNGIPPYEETKTYVKRVRILYDRYKKALNKTFTGRWVSQANTL